METTPAPPKKMNNNLKKENNLKKKTALNITLLNAKSMKTVNSKVNKLYEFQTSAKLNTCDILCVSETWLDKKGGGLLMAVNPNISATVVNDL